MHRPPLHIAEPALRRPDPARQPVPVASGQERRRCRLRGGANGSGGQPGNQNALRHGRYSRELLEFTQPPRAAAGEC